MNPPFAEQPRHEAHPSRLTSSSGPAVDSIAICSEGPFFRQDTAARGVPRVARRDRRRRGAAARQHPSARAAPDVATRIIFAPKPDAATPAADASPPSAAILDIPMDQIEPDPDQPRQVLRAGRAPRTRRLHPGGRPAAAHRRAALDHRPDPLRDRCRRAALACPPDQRCPRPSGQSWSHRKAPLTFT